MRILEYNLDADYVEQQNKILAKIEEFDRTHDFWEPAPLLKRLAQSGQGFSAL